ncbi:hypothetical protein MRX96_015273 [Rhipicephalus microplus]
MVTFGRVEEYDSKEPWPSYTERLDAFFNANGIEDDEKKKWTFLSTIGTNKLPEYYLQSLRTQSSLKPITMTFSVNGVPLEMELDTGSPVSIISKDTYLQHQGALPELSQADIIINCIRGTIPVQGTLSVDRWVLILGAYTYSTEHRPGRFNGNTGAMSRLPLTELYAEPPEPPELVNAISKFEKLAVSVKQLQQFADIDHTLRQVLQWVRVGWPQSSPDKAFQAFWQRRDELSVHNNPLYWGN